MFCEYCGNTHDGSFGSGRFCRKECSRAFSTRDKRSEISNAVSEKLKGRKLAPHVGFQPGVDPRRKVWTDEDRQLAAEKIKQTCLNKYQTTGFEDLSRGQKFRRVKEEQHFQCLDCSNSDWMGQPITLEIDHIDGDNKNNARANLRALCPNCHSLTPTWRKKKPSQEYHGTLV